MRGPFLWDVQQAANAIDQFIAGLDAAGYEENALVRAAVGQQFEIIGVSLSQLSMTRLGLSGLKSPTAFPILHVSGNNLIRTLELPMTNFAQFLRCQSLQLVLTVTCC